jgi:streptomycin 6-kinase
VIRVPAAFAQWRIHLDGDAGRQWIESLPALVERLLSDWHLELDDPRPLHGALSLVLLVRRGDEPLALKVTWLADATTMGEAVALRTWAGHGMVRLLAADTSAGALLLERLDHTRTLHALPVFEAAEVAGALVRTLAVPAPAGLHTQREVAANIHDTLLRRQRALGDPVPSRWLAAALAPELGGAGEEVLVHADLHYGNVLAATRQPWLAVDPRAVVGTPEYSVPELIWTRADDLRTDADIRRLLDTLVRAGGLNGEIAHGWVVTRCVDYWLWGLEHGLTIDPVRCERVLHALVQHSSA